MHLEGTCEIGATYQSDSVNRPGTISVETCTETGWSWAGVFPRSPLDLLIVSEYVMLAPAPDLR